MVDFKGAHFEKDLILTCVRWYVAYPLRYRQREEMMQERGVAVDHSPINRWVLKYSPQLAKAFHRRKRPVWVSWRMEETYIRVRGQWRYLDRAVDKTGQTIDFLLTEQRDERAAMHFLTKAIRRHSVPDKITIDGSEANASAIRSYNQEHGTAIAIRQVKYLNNILEIVLTPLTHTRALAARMGYAATGSTRCRSAAGRRARGGGTRPWPRRQASVRAGRSCGRPWPPGARATAAAILSGGVSRAPTAGQTSVSSGWAGRDRA
jgi:putative transposase